MNTTPRKYYDTVLDGPSTPSGKKLTPMAKILKWVDEKYPNFNKADIEEYITSMLPEEREMVEKSYDAGVSPYGANDGSDYFTNNYQQ